ncbi:MAG: 4Fe-4S binding protein [Archaeoglobi archaeon]|nr:4Fe-4S binding protein [Candidatus Mnemosynella sp.]
MDFFFGLSKGVPGCSGKTGSWRVFKPLKDDSKCNGCKICYLCCPEGCIDEETLQIDYDYCKGCGICANECPEKAIEMVREK